MSEQSNESTRPEFTLSFEDRVNLLLKNGISEALGNGVIITKWLTICEVVDANNKSLVALKSVDLAAWDYIGFLRAELAAAESLYSSDALSYGEYYSEEDED